MVSFQRRNSPSISRQARSGSLLGESSTAGTGHNLPDAETWPCRTAELLKAQFAGRDIEFINAAAGGYTTFESDGRLWSRLRFFRPDIVVVYHGWNDMYYFNPTDLDAITRWRVLDDGTWSLVRRD